MKEYQIVEYYEAKELARLVNNSMAEGWLPCGGVVFTLTNVGPGTYHKNYAQAMIRDKPPDLVEVGEKSD